MLIKIKLGISKWKLSHHYLIIHNVNKLELLKYTKCSPSSYK